MIHTTCKVIIHKVCVQLQAYYPQRLQKRPANSAFAIDFEMNAKQQCSTPLHTSRFDGNFNHGYIYKYICYRKICAKKTYFAHWLTATWQHSHGIFFFNSIFHYKEWILMNYNDNGFVSYCFSVNPSLGVSTQGRLSSTPWSK